MTRVALLILALLAVAFAVLTGLAVHKGILAPPQPAEQTATVGGPFQLVDQSGRSVDEKVLQGKWSAVFFGFTECPEACPTTLFALGQAEKALGARARTFQTVLISVDPERDTPAKLATYLSNEAFPRHALGLTGPAEQIARTARAYRVYYSKSGDGADYTVDHSAITYLMGPAGQLVCVIPYGAAPQAIAAKVARAMDAGPRANSC